MPTNPNYNSKFPLATIREIALPHPGAIKIGPFGSQLNKEDLSREGYKVYGQENVIASDFSIGTRRIDATKFSTLGSCRLFPGDLILTMMGTIGKCSIFPEEAEIGIMDSHLLRIQINPEIANARFIAMVVAAEEVVGRQIERLSHGSIMSGLSSTIVQRLQVPLAPLSEQRLITNILNTLDTQIQQTEQLIAKLKQMKIGLLHDLFTKGIDDNGDVRDPVAHPERFQSSKLGKIPQEWDILLIKEAGIVQLGRQRSPRHQTGQHTTPYLRVANVFDGFIDFSDILSMDFNPEERKTYNLIPGDILLNEGQSLELVGRSAIYQGPPDTYCFQNTLVRFRCNSRTIPEYCRAVFKYWLDTGKFTTVAKQTTSIAHLGADRFAQMSLCMPSLDEQHRIAVILNSHDTRITAEESYLAKLKQLKNGLMHNLLTGRVRVTQLMAESEQLDVRSKSVSGCK